MSAVTVTCCIHETSYTKKPGKYDFPTLSCQLPSQEHTVSPSSLAACCGSRGHTFSPATFGQNQRTAACFQQQQVFALDFDDTLSLHEVMDRCRQVQLPLSFVYETFSSTKENRFRAVFIHNCSIDSAIVSKIILTMLIGLFPEADKSCIDVARMFFGGKKVLYQHPQINDFEATFTVFELNTALIAYLSAVDSKNVARKIRTILSKTGIGFGSTFPFINEFSSEAEFFGMCQHTDFYQIKDLSKKIEEIRISSTLLVENRSTFPQFIKINDFYSFYFLVNFKQKNSFHVLLIQTHSTPLKNNNVSTVTAATSIRKKSQKKLLQDFPFKELPKYCQLYRSFQNGETCLDHHHLFGLATQFSNIKEGKTHFFNLLSSSANDDYGYNAHRRWDYYYNYLVSQRYLPRNCIGFCPYHDQCRPSSNMISKALIVRKEIRQTSQPHYSPLPDAEQELEQHLLEALDAKGKDIHLIEAQTGLGKSTAYLRHLDRNNTRKIIAVPTNKLKDAIVKSATDKGYCVMGTPSLPRDQMSPSLLKKVESLFQKGAYRLARLVMEKAVKRHPSPALSAYLEDDKKIFSFSGHLVTTHSKLFTLDASFLQKYDVIIDEDVFRTALRMETVTLQDLRKLKSKLPLPVTQAINLILRRLNRHPLTRYDALPPLDKACHDDLECFADKRLLTNALDFLRSEAAFLDKERLQYAFVQKLPDTKIVLLSATANKELYQKLFCRDIHVYETKEAAYQGRLLQYHDASYSRSYLAEHLDQVIENVRVLCPGNPVITFKIYEQAFCPEQELHFGNLEGHNDFTGESLSIVGTPHVKRCVYDLIGLVLGVPEKTVRSANLSSQPLERNGYRFWFHTFTHPLLREIQLWLIEQELEQAVGRARLLRHDCQVTVFSNFPLRQAILERDLPALPDHQSLG
ncbi:hypothetical protein AAIG11_14750 [Anoxynatronum sibiricum]|uniref:Helicase ATP-binding domain-containing protein n=2 Tax=Anoxynatronum sibiricum TaxID=210623 RepID=A0ABU9VX53_9CLOT